MTSNFFKFGTLWGLTDIKKLNITGTKHAITKSTNE